MTPQATTNNLNYLIDPTFNEVNRLFVLSFNDKDHRPCFAKHYTPSIEIKYFNGKIFFDMPVKIKEEKHTKRLLKWTIRMITQLVVY